MKRIPPPSLPLLNTTTLVVVSIMFGAFVSAQAQDSVHGGPPGTGWTKVFEDNFNGPSVDTSKWLVENRLSGNTYYSSQNVFIQNGNLVLKSERRSVQGSTFASGSVRTLGKRAFLPRVYLEARIHKPMGKGLWFGWWMNGAFQWPPEIDIVELWGAHTPGENSSWPNMAYQTWHFFENGQKKESQFTTFSNNAPWNLNLWGGGWTEGYHIYAAEWAENRITFYIDGIKTGETTASVWDYRGIPMELILGTGLEGGWAPAGDEKTPLPAETRIDWVRVYEQGGVGAGMGNQRPFNGVKQIPGTIQAEDYDLGGLWVAYNDRSGGNKGGQYRTSFQDDVDIFTTSDSGGGYRVGDIETGEWMEYTSNITAGTYRVEARVASVWGGGRLLVKVDGATVAALNVPQTWSDNTFTTVAATEVSMAGGSNRVVRLEASSGGFSLNYVTFVRTGATGPGTSLTGVKALKAQTNQNYVNADVSASAARPLLANRTSIGNSERFRVIANADGSYSLQSLANNRYVCADANLGTSRPLVANRTAIGSWEKFEIIANSDGTHSFRCLANGRYVCADQNLSAQSPLHANRTSIGLWEKFRLEDAEP